MNRMLQRLGLLLAVLVGHASHAGVLRKNHGNDPFFQISHAIANCPVPLGPFLTDKEWHPQVHFRVEDGNSCWLEGRCRLNNSYRYDQEIAETVQRRLAFINRSTGWRDNTTLWLILQRRFIRVQGCVSAAFDKKKFLSELAKTADVDRVMDQTTVDPKAVPLPYRTLAHPEVLPPNDE